MQALIALLESRLGLQWSDVVDWLRSQNGIEELERRLATGNIEDVIADVKNAAEKFAADLHNAYTYSGQASAEWLDKQVADSMIHFDTAAPEIVARARNNALEQVSGLTNETRATIRAIQIDAAQTGVNPRVTAVRIRDSIGLAPNQEIALQNYRDALDSGQYGKALGYELGHGHSDRTIAAAQSSGRAMTQEQKDLAVERYRVNAINDRAETIARTEALRVAHQGTGDALRQAITRGNVDADELTKAWAPGPRTRFARPDHAAMGRQAPIGVLEDFVLPDGTRMSGPGDPRGGAKHVIRCRCAQVTRYRAA